LRQTSAIFLPAFLLAQNPDDLLFREPTRIHGPSPSEVMDPNPRGHGAFRAFAHPTFV